MSKYGRFLQIKDIIIWMAMFRFSTMHVRTEKLSTMDVQMSVFARDVTLAGNVSQNCRGRSLITSRRNFISCFLFGSPSCKTTHFHFAAHYHLNMTQTSVSFITESSVANTKSNTEETQSKKQEICLKCSHLLFCWVIVQRKL